MTLDKLFLSLHVIGVFMWVGGLFSLFAFLEAYLAQTDPTARARLLPHLRKQAIMPDIGGTLAIVFGLHWLFKFDLYEAHYMHAKLLLVAVLIGTHGYLKFKAKHARKGEPFTAPAAFVRPLLMLLVTAIVIFVISKVPL